MSKNFLFLICRLVCIGVVQETTGSGAEYPHLVCSEETEQPWQGRAWEPCHAGALPCGSPARSRSIVTCSRVSFQACTAALHSGSFSPMSRCALPPSCYMETLEVTDAALLALHGEVSEAMGLMAALVCPPGSSSAPHRMGNSSSGTATPLTR